MSDAAFPVCFNVMGRLMPVLRAETARRLMVEGLQQERIAEHLGVSQAMVSKYLRRPPVLGTAAPSRVVAELVDASVRLALQEESKGRIPAWCPVCQSLATRGLSCSVQPGMGVDECLRRAQERPSGGRGTVLENLVEAEQRIRRIGLKPLLPEVRSNLAMALPDAKDSRDVAAFPGRFIEMRGEVRGAAPPEFGSSSHLAQVLLKLRRYQPKISAILNARFDDGVRKAVRPANLRVRPLRRSHGELALVVPDDDAVDAVVDPGAFGIEPALYILGETAVEVVAKTERLLRKLNPGGNRK